MALSEMVAFFIMLTLSPNDFTLLSPFGLFASASFFNLIWGGGEFYPWVLYLCHVQLPTPSMLSAPSQTHDFFNYCYMYMHICVYIGIYVCMCTYIHIYLHTICWAHLVFIIYVSVKCWQVKLLNWGLVPGEDWVSFSRLPVALHPEVGPCEISSLHTGLSTHV